MVCCDMTRAKALVDTYLSFGNQRHLPFADVTIIAIPHNAIVDVALLLSESGACLVYGIYTRRCILINY